MYRYVPEPSSTLSMMTAVTDCRDIDGILLRCVLTGRDERLTMAGGLYVRWLKDDVRVAYMESLT